MKLKRKVCRDTATEQFKKDGEENRMLLRSQRKEYEAKAQVLGSILVRSLIG